MDHSNGQDDEIAIDPLKVPGAPVFRALPAIAGRLHRAWLAAKSRWRLTWRGWLLAAIAAVIVVGTLKLTGAIWTSEPPTWEPALGAGVKVTAPEQVAPGHGSPGAALAGALAALSARNPAAECEYEYGSAARCKAENIKAPQRQPPYQLSVKIGYVAIDGTRALVGYTGNVCSEGASSLCITNADPAAIFSSGNTFETLWRQTLSSTSNGGYTLLLCVEVSGKWYVGSGSA